MTLIKSISGIRGTIGGSVGESLSPVDILKFSAGYSKWIKQNNPKPKVVVARDARMSGQMVFNLLSGGLLANGVDVIDLGLETTPTTEMAVTNLQADGGIILTASHNPKQWNALKLLNKSGEFLSAEDGALVLEYSNEEVEEYPGIDEIGKLSTYHSALQEHIEQIHALPYVDVNAIQKKEFTVVVDGINSVGAKAVPELLKSLGCKNIIVLNEQMHGDFDHNPEPLPDHLSELIQAVKTNKADLGIAVDPDVDRLAFVTEEGEWFGEEYTLVAIADFITSITPGPTVSNLSSTKALKELTESKGLLYTPAAVGEVNVVKTMKATNAVIGGEGNGGVILPELHYGRDALVGIALMLSFMAKEQAKLSQIRQRYPSYHIAKKKADLEASDNMELILEKVAKKYKQYPQNTEDGLKILFEEDWVHIRKSNTEPIMRIYIESATQTVANRLGSKIIEDIQQFR